MKVSNLILLLSLFLSINGFSKTSVDSLKIRLSHIENLNQKRIDSLQRELQFYKVKEDYFANAVSDQANQFYFLFGLIISIATALGLGYFKIKIDSVRNELSTSLQQKDDELKALIGTANDRYNSIVRVSTTSVIQHANLMDNTAIEDVTNGMYTKGVNSAYNSIQGYCFAHDLSPSILSLEKLQERLESLTSIMHTCFTLLNKKMQEPGFMNTQVLFHRQATLLLDQEELIETLLFKYGSSPTRERYYSIRTLARQYRNNFKEWNKSSTATN